MARLQGGHDTNVPLAATGTQFQNSTETNVLALGLTGDYRLYRDASWTVLATGAFQQTRNGSPALRDFDLTSFAPGVAARYGFRMSGRPAVLSLSYAARRDWLGGSGFDTANVLSADLGWRLTRSTGVGLYGAVSQLDFDDDGPQAEFSSRDAVAYIGGVRGTMGFDRNRHLIQATLGYIKNDAEGVNFVFRGPTAGAQYTWFFWGPWAASASANYVKNEYTSYAVTPRRESSIYDYRFVLLGPITRKVSVDLAYGRSRYDSNEEAFRAKREGYALGFTYLF